MRQLNQVWPPGVSRYTLLAKPIFFTTAERFMAPGRAMSVAPAPIQYSFTPLALSAVNCFSIVSLVAPGPELNTPMYLNMPGLLLVALSTWPPPMDKPAMARLSLLAIAR